MQYGRLLKDNGRFTESLVQLRAARELDPASALVLSHMTMAYLMSGQLDSAVKESRRALETDSTNYTTLLAGTWVNLAVGQLKEAHALAVRTPPDQESLGYFLAKSGETQGAREVLARLNALPHYWGAETQRALTYLGLGDTAQGLSALERATDAAEIWPMSASIRQTPYDAIRKTARFRVLLERVGLSEYMAALTR